MKSKDTIVKQIQFLYNMMGKLDNKFSKEYVTLDSAVKTLEWCLKD